MRIYVSVPQPEAARNAWKHFSKKNGKAPLRLWKMPGCFRKARTYKVEHGAWGLWVADYGEHKDYYDPTLGTAARVERNLFSFLKTQAILANLDKFIKE